MSTRDPRVDPKPGDVLLKPIYAAHKVERTITVISVAHGAVRITCDPPLPSNANYFHHADWPFLMRFSEVIHAAD